MFVRYYVFIDLPFDEVERSLLDSREGWLQRVAEGASRSSLTLARVGVGARRAQLGKLVQIRFGEPFRRDAKRTALPFTWLATSVPFPKFEGDIEISHWRPATTQLAVSATYQPPLGPLGRALDRAALHLLAEALIKDFVDGIAVEIRAQPQRAPRSLLPVVAGPTDWPPEPPPDVDSEA